MTNEEKLNLIKSEFKNYILNIETLVQLKSFLNNITKAKVINMLKAKIQEHITVHSGHAVCEQERADELTTFKDGIDQFLG